MTVRDVMTTAVVTCGSDVSLAAATALMWKNGCGALPVVTENGKLAGILTDRDICLALGTRNAPAADLCVRDLIQDTTFICKSSDDIHTALQRMRQGRIRRLPVVTEDARLEGIVSIDDIVLSSKADSGNGVSYADVVNTLQAICAHDQRVCCRPAAA